MSLFEYIEGIKFDFTEVELIPDTTNIIKSPFEIKPIQYLEFAKLDIELNSLRGYINAITNSKRAIDCICDSFFSVIGCNNITINTESVDLFLNEFGTKDTSIAKNLNLIRSYNLAPVIIVSQIRNLRNIVEHEYKKINYKQSINAIETAELFLGCIRQKIESIWDFQLYNAKYQTELYFTFKESKIEINRELEITANDILYHPIIGMMLNIICDKTMACKYFKYFAKCINKNIRVKEIIMNYNLD